MVGNEKNCFKKQFVPNKYIQNNNTFFTNQTAELNILIQGINYDVNGNEIIKKFYNNEVLNFLPILNNTESQKKVYDLTDNFLLFDIYKFNEINKLSSSVVTLYIKNLNSNTKNKSKPGLNKPFLFSIKIADFYFEENAINLRDRIISETLIKNVKILKKTKNKHRVFIGPYRNINSLQNKFYSINNLGFENIEILRHEDI